MYDDGGIGPYILHISHDGANSHLDVEDWGTVKGVRDDIVFTPRHYILLSGISSALLIYNPQA